MNTKGIREQSYELYKLIWMKEHGYSLQDLAAELAALSDEGIPSVEEVFSEFEQNGFSPSGEIYACFDEFIDNEYLDMEYMRSLLSKEDFMLYLRDIEKADEPAKVLRQKADDEYAKYESYAKKHGSAYEQLVYAYIHMAIMNGDLDEYAVNLYTTVRPIESLYEEIESDNDLLYSRIVDYLKDRLEDMEAIE